ncbi:hypothetical protein C8R48DRAFT_672377 [Suillus tomentosus]|nr:hypothetical protein C8R48DRAFT_672377 [Suillus tomentosus]
MLLRATSIKVPRLSVNQGHEADEKSSMYARATMMWLEDEKGLMVINWISMRESPRCQTETEISTLDPGRYQPDCDSSLNQLRSKEDVKNLKVIFICDWVPSDFAGGRSHHAYGLSSRRVTANNVYSLLGTSHMEHNL